MDINKGLICCNVKYSVIEGRDENGFLSKA